MTKTYTYNKQNTNINKGDFNNFMTNKQYNNTTTKKQSNNIHISFKRDLIIKETEKAVLVKINQGQVWIPKTNMFKGDFSLLINYYGKPEFTYNLQINENNVKQITVLELKTILENESQ